jgi:hypothetical protein
VRIQSLPCRVKIWWDWFPAKKKSKDMVKKYDVINVRIEHEYGFKKLAKIQI